MNKTVPNDIFHSGCNKCAYCGISSRQTKCILSYPPRTRRFIFYCNEHNADAERDILLAHRELGLFRQSDVLKQPIFKVLPEYLTVNGSCENRWCLDKTIIDGNTEFVHRFDDEPTTWAIRIIHDSTGETKPLPVSELKLSLPIEHHRLVDDLIAWLSANSS